MLTARLVSLVGYSEKEIQSGYFVSDGAFFRDASGSTIVEHRDALWHGQGDVFVSIEFLEPVVLRFAAPGVHTADTYGPLRPLRLAEGGMWRTRQTSELIAEFDQASLCWNFGRMRHDISVLTFEAVGSA